MRQRRAARDRHDEGRHNNENNEINDNPHTQDTTYEKPRYYAHSGVDPTGTTIAEGWKPEADM